MDGVLSYTIDRDTYDTFVKDGIIRDTVIKRARAGSRLTFQLFNQLLIPAWKECEIDLKGFVTSVGPTLENFWHIYHKLRSDFPSLLLREATVEQQQEEVQADVLGKNLWRQRAERDPESLEAALLNMTTDTLFDSLYYFEKVHFLFPDSAPVRPFSISRDSFKVNQVALLRARTLYEFPNIEHMEFPEFAATDMPEETLPVVAQMDLLYEATPTFELDETNDGSTSGKQKQVTNCGVVIFEAWIRGSDPLTENYVPQSTENPSEHEVQWKLAMLRQADEFPRSKPIVT